MAKTTASASGTKRNLATPVRKNIGTKTMQMERVETNAGTSDLRGTIENRLFYGLAHLDIAIDVLDFDSGVIYKDADSERQTAEGHDVDGFAQRAQHQQR